MDADDLIPSLRASDLATEVKAEFDGRLAIGYDVPGATSHVFSHFRQALGNSNDGPVILLALAALQMREQYLQTVIRDAALDLIASGEALAAYRADDSQLRSDRRTLLEQFTVALQSAETTDADD